MAFVPKPLERKVHRGSLASALSLRQMPPPAAAIQTRQVLRLHDGSIAIAVTRPETPKSEAWSSNTFRTAGTVAVAGPTRFQPLALNLLRPATLFW